MQCENSKMSEFFFGVVDIAKHLFGSHIPEQTDEGFQFVCFHQGVFFFSFFYLGMRGRSALSKQSLMITLCLPAS